MMTRHDADLENLERQAIYTNCADLECVEPVACNNAHTANGDGPGEIVYFHAECCPCCPGTAGPPDDAA